jgi:hypothetical protein
MRSEQAVLPNPCLEEEDEEVNLEANFITIIKAKCLRINFKSVGQG